MKQLDLDFIFDVSESLLFYYYLDYLWHHDWCVDVAQLWLLIPSCAIKDNDNNFFLWFVTLSNQELFVPFLQQRHRHGN